jgi:hypothetical protein
LAFEIGAVRQSINFTHDSASMSAKVFAGNVTDDPMAVYLDFGTGKHAARFTAGLPNEFRMLAMRYYKTGRGTLKTHDYLSTTYIQESKRLSERLKGFKIGW